jgi:predicted enzyme related to lactoylglutathione lyase
MTEVDRHEPGSFSWAELATSDPKAAKSFYTGVFGWSYAGSHMVLVPAMDMEKVGRFSILADPQAAAFAVIELVAA